MNRHERDDAYLFHTYKRLPLDIERGEGLYLYSAGGNRYLDMFSGLAVNALGYNHPRVVRAICRQAERYTHLSNYFVQEPQLQLAELLVKHSGFDRVFFANSGTEAVEGAIKLSRKWGATQKKTVLHSFTNAFHGRTMGALSLMDRPKYREGFGPFLGNVTVSEYNNADALRSAVGKHTAGVVLEFIQGEGGIRPVTPAFADALRKLKGKFGFLIIADEIQSGVGRTGKFFAFQHFDAAPDIVVLAKPIGGGLPLGAILSSTTIAALLEPGTHGTTFGGNPVACAAGTAVINEIMEQQLMRNAAAMGGLMKERLLALQKLFPKLITEVRGFGLMLGLQLTVDGEPAVAAMRERGILINCTDQTVLRFLPPLIVQTEHVNETCDQLKEVLTEMSQF